MDNLFEKIIDKYKNLDGVEAIAKGGSSTANTSDNISDIDIYIFTTKSIELGAREGIIKEVSSKYEAGGEYFGSGDEYFVDDLGIQFDVMFWDKNWFCSVFENVWEKHYPSNGYTTCFLYTLKNFEIMFDKTGWLAQLQKRLKTPYPQELKANILKRNTMLMKDKPFASYYQQIEKALIRNDIISVNHRTAAFLASYFDVIFAVNELLHPGEKRLIQFAKDNCKILPLNFEQNLQKLLASNSHILPILDDMVEKLKAIL